MYLKAKKCEAILKIVSHFFFWPSLFIFSPKSSILLLVIHNKNTSALLTQWGKGVVGASPALANTAGKDDAPIHIKNNIHVFAKSVTLYKILRKEQYKWTSYSY